MKGKTVGFVQTLFESSRGFDAVCDLIPVKPLAEEEGRIRQAYKETLTRLHSKLEGA